MIKAYKDAITGFDKTKKFVEEDVKELIKLGKEDVTTKLDELVAEWKEVSAAGKALKEGADKLLKASNEAMTK